MHSHRTPLHPSRPCPAQNLPYGSEDFLLFPPDNLPFPTSWGQALSWDLLSLHSHIQTAQGKETPEELLSFCFSSTELCAAFLGKHMQYVFHLEIFLHFSLALGIFRLPFILFLFLPCWAGNRGCHGHKAWKKTGWDGAEVHPQTNHDSKLLIPHQERASKIGSIQKAFSNQLQKCLISSAIRLPLLLTKIQWSYLY